MSAPHRPVDPQQRFPALEERILERWRERDVFRESLRRREGAEPWVFYEGPPTANGRPGSHHVLARVFKDIYPRYKTMRGHYVERKGGWDCHGLPVEIAVEEKLGISAKAEIEEYGIAAFNAAVPRVGVRVPRGVEPADRADRLLDRPRRRLPDARPRATSSRCGGRSRRCGSAGLLYEGHKVVPYCPRCGTALSSHEVALGYRDVVDPSVYVRFPVIDPPPPLEPGDELLVWTTTPWTLVSNAAVAVDPDAPVRARPGGGRAASTCSPRRSSSACSARAPTCSSCSRASSLEGTRYEPPFDFIPASAYGERGHTVVPGDFVTRAGRHRARAHRDRLRRGRLPAGRGAGAGGGQPGAARRHLRRAHRPVRRAASSRTPTRTWSPTSSARGRLFRAEEYEHAYPHCWRCGTPLLYYAKPSWYIRTSELRDRLLAANETVDWHPEHIKHGRFGKWLEGNVDWALSRERYWGTPLPVWRCENGPRALHRRLRRARGAVGACAWRIRTARSSTRSRSRAPSARSR